MPLQYQTFRYIPYDPIKITRQNTNNFLNSLFILIIIFLCITIIIIVYRKKYQQIYKPVEIEMKTKTEIQSIVYKDSYPKFHLNTDSVD